MAWVVARAWGVCRHFTPSGARMKLKDFWPTALTVATFTTLTLAGAAVHAANLVGLTSSNELARIDTSNVAAATRVAITGLAASDRFVGIDLRPGDNKIYGITLSNSIYTVNELTGATTFVAALSSPIVSPNLGYGIDFNPVNDFAGTASLRFVSSAGGNFAVNANTGVVGNAANTIAPGFSAVAYTNSNPLPTAAPAATQLYYIDSSNDMLSVATSAFNTPTITTVGSLGIDVLRANGFEILGNGQAFAALNIDAGTSLTTGIYGINLTTGAASLLGTFNGTLSGLTVSAVPEPGTYALMGAGLLAMLFVATRRTTS
jgi:Domain of unknown function (DUF4394)/PEP-CTERM motif